MSDLKARWLSLIEEYSTKDDVPIAEPVQVAPHETSLDSVSETTADLSADVATEDLKTRWLSILKKYSAQTDVVIAEPVQPVITHETIDSVSETTEELTVYEATPAQIDYWHAFGANVFLQTLLREYDLDSSNPNAFNRFKIGLDEKRHLATFAIDETHYYQIQFNSYNSAPADKNSARVVLEKINQIRLSA